MLDGCVPWPKEFADRYRDEGYWQGVVLGDLLRTTSREDSERVAVVAGEERLSYGTLDTRADRLAAGLRGLGVGHHDRVIVQLPNSVEFVVVLVALFRVGAVPVLALPAHRRSEICYLARHCDAVAYIVPDIVDSFDYRELAAEVSAEAPTLRHVLVAGDPGPFKALDAVDDDPGEAATPDPGDVAFFLLSGGTTGAPKLIPRTHDDYAFQMRATAREMGLDRDGVYLAALPAAHNAALGCPGVLGTLWQQGRVVLGRTPSPDEVFPLIEREGVTLTTLMPAFVALWVELADLYEPDFSGLTIEVGGAKLDPEVARQVRPVLGATLSHWFGMAEGPLCFTRRDADPETVALTQGYPLCEADELRVVDEDGADVAPGAVGELLYRGPTTLRGYYRAEEHNARTMTPEGFLRTGDLVRIDDEGRLVVEGRSKDVVNRGGEKVPAEEVEENLRGHPGVRDAAVLAIPDRALGEKTCAVIVAEGEAPALAELKDFLSGRGMAEFKLPDRLETVPALPYTSIGKIDKRALRAQLDQGRESSR
ncbi:(2,3-dihydroxybenzoyl)adenylate synthase [Salinactinospora qingdaonensis]|uniref:(2,3-dihydroxybenzoyl)adenylate synthase n=1 Tax=Salinactinospora qingdaonensis TaxID=702744 RepID=A0ABP7F9U2_9ACTN